MKQKFESSSRNNLARAFAGTSFHLVLLFCGVFTTSAAQAGLSDFDGKWIVSVSSHGVCARYTGSFVAQINSGQVVAEFKGLPRNGTVSPNGNIVLKGPSQSGYSYHTYSGRLSGNKGRGKLQVMNCSGSFTMRRDNPKAPPLSSSPAKKAAVSSSNPPPATASPAPSGKTSKPSR